VPLPREVRYQQFLRINHFPGPKGKSKTTEAENPHV
jgi:hypothetical protein